ncbi:MAG: hypothetical protein M1352_02125 [Patescibacteria group bacterium]|nr:hypothetical protein [Patescibacteria group bacterium]
MNYKQLLRSLPFKIAVFLIIVIPWIATITAFSRANPVDVHFWDSLVGWIIFIVAVLRAARTDVYSTWKWYLYTVLFFSLPTPLAPAGFLIELAYCANRAIDSFVKAVVHGGRYERT